MDPSGEFGGTFRKICSTKPWILQPLLGSFLRKGSQTPILRVLPDRALETLKNRGLAAALAEALKPLYLQGLATLKELFRTFRVPHCNQGSYQNLTFVTLAYANA